MAGMTRALSKPIIAPPTTGGVIFTYKGLLENGDFGTGDLTGWTANPVRLANIGVATSDTGVGPPPGTAYRVSYIDSGSAYTDIWIEQEVSEARILEVYGKPLADLLADGAVFLSFAGVCTHVSSVQNYGLSVKVTQYNAGGGVVSTNTFASYPCEDPGAAWRGLSAVAPIHTDASYFKVRITNIRSSNFTYIWFGALSCTIV